MKIGQTAAQRPDIVGDEALEPSGWVFGIAHERILAMLRKTRSKRLLKRALARHPPLIIGPQIARMTCLFPGASWDGTNYPPERKG